MKASAVLVAASLLGCSSTTEPAEPVRALTLPDGVTLASGQFGLDPTTREYTIFLGLRNERTTPVDATYGLCTFLVVGYASAETSGKRLWTRLLPQLNGCGPDVAMILRVGPQSTGYITVGTVPANILEGSGSVGLIVQIEGEPNLRVVRLAEVVVD